MSLGSSAVHKLSRFPTPHSWKAGSQVWNIVVSLTCTECGGTSTFLIPGISFCVDNEQLQGLKLSYNNLQ